MTTVVMTRPTVANDLVRQAASKRLVKARTQLLLNHLFFGRLALYLRLVEEESVPTLAVDGRHIFYNPTFVSGLSDPLLQAALAHEIMHCVFKHTTRRNGRDPHLWNCAGDYAINLVLKDAGFSIGKGWLLDEAWRDMSSEAIYDALRTNPPPFQMEPLCDIRDGYTSPADRAQAETEWQVNVVGAAIAAERAKPGTVPQALRRFIDETLAPKVSWRDVLRRFITQSSRDDYSWARANRKFVHMGLFMPALYSESMGPLTVVIDTSGSISNAVLSAFAAEIKDIVHQVRPSKLTVIYADAEVNHVDVFGLGEEPHFAMHGGGGTDFRPALKLAAEDAAEPPVALVYLTDLEGPTGDTAPDFPVLWCCTTEHVAPWGETVKLEL